MKRYKTFFSWIILIILVILLVNYIMKNFQSFSSLEFVNPIYLSFMLLTMLISFFVGGLLNRYFLEPFGVKITKFEAFSLAIVTRFYNLVTPFRGGAIARAIYLKKKHNFAYLLFLSTLYAVYILIFLVASFLGIISMIIIYLKKALFPWTLFLLFLLVFLGALSVIFFSPKFKESNNQLLNKFIKVINGWGSIKGNRKIILSTLIITFIQTLLSSLMLWFQFRVFGVNVNPESMIFLAAIGALSLLINITPGNIGISEAIIVFSATLIGITPTQSLSATLLGRAVSFIVLFTLGPIFSYTLIQNKGGKK